MKARRSFNLALPASDPNSALIIAWLAAQPAGMDVSRQLRQALVAALEIAPILQRIEAKIDQLKAASTAAAPGETPDDETTQMIAHLLDFDHLR
jgi:hypothetical protein